MEAMEQEGLFQVEEIIMFTDNSTKENVLSNGYQ